MQEILFESACPYVGCINNNKTYTWTHYNCGGHEKLNRYGDLRCVKCGRSAPMVDWLFDCGNHGFQRGSYQGYKHLCMIMISIADTDDEIEFAQNLSFNVIPRWRKEGKFNY